MIYCQLKVRGRGVLGAFKTVCLAQQWTVMPMGGKDTPGTRYKHLDPTGVGWDPKSTLLLEALLQGEQYRDITLSTYVV